MDGHVGAGIVCRHKRVWVRTQAGEDHCFRGYLDQSMGYVCGRMAQSHCCVTMLGIFSIVKNM